jgi:radical SAM protein with 4Fe4S-binding SPASM domain
MPPNSYLLMGRDRVLVFGAKHALLIDFSAATTHQLDESTTSAIRQMSDAEQILSAIDSLKEVIAPGAKSLRGETASSKIMECSRGGFCAHQPPSEKDIAGLLDLLWIELTARCNLRCLHCYASSAAQQNRGLPNKTIKTIINQAAELGCHAIQFTGGECLLRKDICDLIEHALNRGVKLIEIFTNATLLTESLIKFLSQKRIQVALSLYSYRAEVHDRITGVPGSFDKTLAALELLLAYNVPTRCAIVAMKQNEQDLDRTAYFLSQLGVGCQLPDPVRPSGRGTRSDIWPETYGLRFLRTQPHFSVSAADFKRNFYGNSCWYGKAAVTSNGNVIPCVFAREQIAGQVPAQTLKEIISGEKMQSYWSLTYDRVEGCKACEYRYLCTDCRPLALGLTGSLYAKSPRCTYNPNTGVWGATN